MDNEVDYIQLTDDIVSDCNHLLSASVDKTITNYYYSAEFVSEDNAITLLFEQEIENQNDTIETIAEEIKQGLIEGNIPDGLIIMFLKHSGVQDIFAEMYSLEFEGEEE